MKIELIAVLGVIGVGLSVAAGAMLWDRHLVFRLLPLIASVALGFLYFPLRGIEPTLQHLGQMILGMVLAGAIINLGLWVECRNTGKAD